MKAKIVKMGYRNLFSSVYSVIFSMIDHMVYWQIGHLSAFVWLINILFF